MAQGKDRGKFSEAIHGSTTDVRRHPLPSLGNAMHGDGQTADQWSDEEFNTIKDRKDADDLAPPPSFQLYCDAINESNDSLANMNDRLDRMLSRMRGEHPRDEKAEARREISSAGYNDTLGQLCTVYDAQVKRYYCLVDELERFL